MTPIWSPEAIDDLASLRAYMAEDSPAAAQRVVIHILHNVKALFSEHRVIGRPGHVPRTRKIVISDMLFIVPYRVRDADNSGIPRFAYCTPLARDGLA